MGSIQQEDITFIIIHVLNIGVPKYIKKILIEIKGEMYSNTVIEDLIPHLLQWIDHLDSKLVKDIFGKMYLIDLDNFIQQQQNTHSFQVYMEYFSRQITYYVKKQALISLRRLESYQASF